ncbi:MAG: BCCT family transporter, partial [Pseudomonadota bacterium]
MDFKEATKLIDKPTFFGALFLLLAVTIPLLLWPEQGELVVQEARNYLTDKLGVGYLALGFVGLLFMIYIIFTDIGRIKLGAIDEEPEFSDISWIAMLFCAGIGAGIVYWGPIEWAYYYQDPPFFAEPQSAEAMRWATTYGMYHWGPIAWAIYLIPAVPIAYYFHVRRKKVLKLSQALAPVIGTQNTKNYWGKIIDVLFVFGMLGGGATSLGLAAPLINEGLHQLFDTPRGIWAQIVILLVCTSIFGASAYSGLKKGIQRLSNLNIAIALSLLGYILLVGPTTFILETSLQSIGTMLTNFVAMSTWLEPSGGYNNFPDTSFPADWTIFYWAWWLAFAPSVGIFIARISKGRTIANMVSGSLVWGSFGCALFFMILGNYGSYLQITGELDVVAILNNDSAQAAICAILG